MKAKYLVLIMLLVNFCHGNSISPTFTLKNKNARMPVIVRGNISSNVLVVFLHGGPGGTSFKKIGTRAFDSLEQFVGMVYWDQRGAAESKGGTDKMYMTLSQFVEDLDLLIDELNKRYKDTDIFLMGHCWGGGLGTAYLTDKKRQTKINGWIEIAGSHNNPKGDSLSAAWVKQHAHTMIRVGKQAQYWKKALNWYDKHPTFSSNALGHYDFVRRANGYQLIKNDSLGPYPGYKPIDLLKSPIKYVSYYANYFTTLNKFIISDINLTDKLKEIEVPSLILWGDKDGLVPVEIGFETFEELGTPFDKKELIIFNNTAHSIFYEQPGKFTKTVLSFIDHNKSAESALVAKNSVRF